MRLIFGAPRRQFIVLCIHKSKKTDNGATRSWWWKIHQRITDHATPIIGADLDLGDYKQVTHQTFSKQLDIRTRKDYRLRIQRIIDYWKKECPEYIAAGDVADVWDEEDLHDETKYFFKGKFTEDIQYSGIHVQFVIKALAILRKKGGERLNEEHDDGVLFFLN